MCEFRSLLFSVYILFTKSVKLRGLVESCFIGEYRRCDCASTLLTAIIDDKLMNASVLI